MVHRVNGTLEGIVPKSLYVMTQGYIESITAVRQFPHRDFLRNSLPVDGVAVSIFWAFSMDILDDDECAQWVGMYARVFHHPWVVHHMPMKRGSLWVVFSTLIHEGEGLPLSAEPGRAVSLGFAGCSHMPCPALAPTTPHAIILGIQE